MAWARTYSRDLCTAAHEMAVAKPNARLGIGQATLGQTALTLAKELGPQLALITVIRY